VSWDLLEGSRAFDVTWGFVTGAICLALAVPILWWWLPEHRRPFFSRAIDPGYRLQLGYGVFCMAMAGTNVGCRAIPHDDLTIVHPVFFAITLALVAGLGPRVASMLLRRPPANA
jgi:CDP-diglyceride synthetase